MDNDFKKNSLLQSLLPVFIEIGIILGLTVIIIIILNFFKLIDLRALFSSSSPVVVQNTNNQPLGQVQQSNSKPPGAKPNPALPNVQEIARNKALHYFVSSFEFEGKIKSIATTPGIDSDQNINYSAKLEIAIGSQSAQVKLLYPKEALSVMKVEDLQKKEIKLTDLAVGDKIVVQTTVGNFATYPNNFRKVLITKE